MSETDVRGTFSLKFGGVPGEISSETLVTMLQSVTGLLEELNRELGAGEKVEIKVRSAEPGSLTVDLAVVPPELVGLVKDFFAGEAVKLATALITFLGSTFALRKHLKKEKPEAVATASNGSVQVTNSQGNTITIDNRVLNVYMTNPTVHQYMGRAFQALDAEPEVSGFEVLDADYTPIFAAERDEFRELATPAVSPEATERKAVEHAQLHIVKPSFEAKLRWQFIYQGVRIGAYVQDPQFLREIESGAETFSKGDFLEAELEIEQTFDPAVNAFLNTEYRVLRVHRHVRRLAQGELPWRAV